MRRLSGADLPVQRAPRMAFWPATLGLCLTWAQGSRSEACSLAGRNAHVAHSYLLERTRPARRFQCACQNLP